VAKAKAKKAENTKKLVIVESPSKAKTINKYLGSDYIVLASKGHLIDLPKSKLGVNLDDNFSPQYIPIRGKASIIKELKKAASKASAVYLAADPDREGEAIGWHIKNFLSAMPKVPVIYRLRLNEITKPAIEEAIKTPSEVDLNMVNAQQARRVLDRLVGYGISPLLWKNIRRGLSAGRVQSVALRLIYEREKEIEGFTPVEYWSLEADFITEAQKVIRTKLAKVDGQKLELKTQAQTMALVERVQKADFKVSAVLHRDKSKKPPMPFTTSKLQQESYKQLRFGARKTMSIAQGLYEGIEIGESAPVGLITYMRTDSKRISPDAKIEAAKFILDTYGEKYLSKGEKETASKNKIQDAHEAIRPTSAFRTPELMKSFLTPEQFKLYQLIWEDFMASQMSPAQYRETSVEITGDNVTFRATGTATVFDGFTKVYEEAADEDKKAQGEPGSEEEQTNLVTANKLNGIAEGQTMVWKEPVPEQHFTQPPPRFTDASMIKTLEEMGIGRPSTYAPTLETIQARRYVKKEAGRFFLAELGSLVLEILMKNFPVILDYAFTAKMEGELDQVESGEIEWRNVIGEFYAPFKDSLAAAEKLIAEDKSKFEQVTTIPCEKCGLMMIVRWGRFGKFIACSNYPTCKNAKGLKETTDGSIQIDDTTTDEKCVKCGGPMMVKAGRFGKFLACAKYPECKSTQGISLKIPCPLGCGGEIVSRGSIRGTFYGCNKYPDCKFVSWNKPINRACPQCASPYLVDKYTKTLGAHISCPNKECDYKEFPNKEEGAVAAPPAVPAGPMGFGGFD
jgi:DNA topoisomerase-1